MIINLAWLVGIQWIAAVVELKINNFLKKKHKTYKKTDLKKK